MLNLDRALALLCPSVPRAQRALILAAMEVRNLKPTHRERPAEHPAEDSRERGSVNGTSHNCSQAPVDGLRGEAEPSAGDRPEGGEGSFLSFSSTPLSGPKPLHPSLRADLTDERLAALLSEWGATS